jgi:hypothetical protein
VDAETNASAAATKEIKRDLVDSRWTDGAYRCWRWSRGAGHRVGQSVN